MSHSDVTRREFTRQADLYAEAPQINDAEAVARLVGLAEPTASDTLLDVACGTGVVTCGFAPRVGIAAGVDLTPAMLRRAEMLGRERGLANVRWLLGDVARLPCGDACFSLVTSRYAVHHLVDPRQVLREMRRVLRPNGRLLIADVAASEDPAKADAFNAMERLRDPSHVRALSESEISRLFEEGRLTVQHRLRYRIEFELEAILKGSFPVPGGAEKIRALFRDSLENDGLGLGPRDCAGEIRFSYPITAWLLGR